MLIRRLACAYKEACLCLQGGLSVLIRRLVCAYKEACLCL